MKPVQRLFGIVLFLSMVSAGALMTSTPAHADEASDLWNQVKARVESMKDYTLNYDFTGPEGAYGFEYRAVRNGPAIRTKILKAPNNEKVNYILVYNTQKSKDQIHVYAPVLLGGGGVKVWKKISEPQIAGKPFVIPVYDLVIKETEGYTKLTKESKMATVAGHQCHVLTFTTANGKVQLAVDKDTKDILQQKVYVGYSVEKERNFYDIKANVNPTIDF